MNEQPTDETNEFDDSVWIRLDSPDKCWSYVFTGPTLLPHVLCGWAFEAGRPQA